MWFKVELRKDVVWFLKHRCTDAEVTAFYEALQRLRDDPIENSQAVSDRRVSRYMLRFFRFGLNGIAIFQLDHAKDRIRVVECRRLPPRRRDDDAQSEPPDGP